jgi:hypothetical protein
MEERIGRIYDEYKWNFNLVFFHIRDLVPDIVQVINEDGDGYPIIWNINVYRLSKMCPHKICNLHSLIELGFKPLDETDTRKSLSDNFTKWTHPILRLEYTFSQLQELPIRGFFIYSQWKKISRLDNLNITGFSNALSRENYSTMTYLLSCFLNHFDGVEQPSLENKMGRSETLGIYDKDVLTWVSMTENYVFDQMDRGYLCVYFVFEQLWPWIDGNGGVSYLLEACRVLKDRKMIMTWEPRDPQYVTSSSYAVLHRKTRAKITSLRIDRGDSYNPKFEIICNGIVSTNWDQFLKVILDK